MIFTDPREADFMLYAVSVVTTGLAGDRRDDPVPTPNSVSPASRCAKTICASSISGFTNRVITINFAIAAIFAGASGALP